MQDKRENEAQIQSETEPRRSVSGWGANVSYGSASDLDGGDADRRASASVFYRRDLTEDWDLSAGVRVTQIDDSDTGNRSSSTVFVNVGRDFNFGF